MIFNASNPGKVLTLPRRLLYVVATPETLKLFIQGRATPTSTHSNLLLLIVKLQCSLELAENQNKRNCCDFSHVLSNLQSLRHRVQRWPLKKRTNIKMDRRNGGRMRLLGNSKDRLHVL